MNDDTVTSLAETLPDPLPSAAADAVQAALIEQLDVEIRRCLQEAARGEYTPAALKAAQEMASNFAIGLAERLLPAGHRQAVQDAAYRSMRVLLSSLEARTKRDS